MSQRTLNRVRKICLSLPDTEEKEAWRAPTFRVKGKMFAMYVDDHHGDGRLALWCNAPPRAQEMAVEEDPESYFVPPYVGGKGWLGVRLDTGLAWEVIEGVLISAHRATAHRRALPSRSARLVRGDVTARRQGGTRSRR
jgi:hypothetical protein